MGCKHHPLSLGQDAGPPDGEVASSDATIADAPEADSREVGSDTGYGGQCGDGPEYAPDDPRLWLSFEGLDDAETYDGAAVVERSAFEGLVLALVDRPAAGGGTAHVVVNGAPAPSVPIGTRLWFTQVVSPGDTFGAAATPHAFIARAQKGGTILFGGAYEHPGGTLTPFAIGGATPMCSVGVCPKTTRLALDVPDATPRRVGDGGPAKIKIGGTAYGLWVTAQSQANDPTAPTASTCTSTVGPQLELAITYVAENVPSLTRALPMESLPACHQGNDEKVDVIFELSRTSTQKYDGPAVYRGRANGAGSPLIFDLPASTPTADDPTPSVTFLLSTPSLLPEPGVGDQLWFTSDGDVGWRAAVLRLASRAGPVKLGVVHVSPGTPETAVMDRIKTVFGFGVVFQVGCTYAAGSGGDSLYTSEVVLLAPPTPTKIDSGNRGHLSIDGAPYDAWVWGLANTSTTLVIWKTLILSQPPP